MQDVSQPQMSWMAREIAEIPTLASALLAQRGAIEHVARHIGAANRKLIVICGRGSSGHAGTYLRYLFEARLGYVVSSAAPSVITAYGKFPDMRDAIFIVISQSGASPDLIAAAEGARRAGALTVGMVNDDRSPVAAACELIMPILAGSEQSVAATKTVVLSMIAGAKLVATLSGDNLLTQALQRTPDRLTDALRCDWSDWSNLLIGAPAAFVSARGYALGSAREIALKIIEVLRLPALAYSAAELRHGPRAAITSATPVLVLRQDDEAAPTVDALICDLRAQSDRVRSAGGPGTSLPWIGDDHPICDPITMLLPAYRAIERTALELGFDPDKPPNLTKITRTK